MSAILENWDRASPRELFPDSLSSSRTRAGSTRSCGSAQDEPEVVVSTRVRKCVNAVIGKEFAGLGRTSSLFLVKPAKQ